jgi:hypothetical protein
MISFELTDEQREIRDWVHSFAEKEIRPVAHQYDESEEFPWPVVKKAAEVGLYGVEFLQQTFADSTGSGCRGADMGVRRHCARHPGHWSADRRHLLSGDP